MSEHARLEVLGRSVALSGGRLVFLGTDAKNAPETFFVGFINEEGHELKFRLSHEALDALIELAKNPFVGMPLREFPAKAEWRLVAP